MRIMLLGANGQLGKEFHYSLKEKCDLFSFSKDDCDITSSKKVNSLIKKISPEIILNTAAYTNVDGAESNSILASKINSEALENLSKTANENNSKLVHFSTDYVFNSKENVPIREDEKKDPINEYGRSKHLGEENILKLCKDFFIFRISWVYGKYGNNFPKKIISLLNNYEKIDVIDDQIGIPTPTTLVTSTVEAIFFNENFMKMRGIYNIAPSGYTNWYEMARIIKLRLDLINTEKFSNKKINPVKSAYFASAARRPHYSRLSNEKLRKTFKINPLNWKVYFKKYIQEQIK